MNSFLEIMFFIYIPILCLCIFMIRKQAKRDTQFYWGCRIQKNTQLKYDRSIAFSYWNMSIGIILVLTLLYITLAQLSVLDINKIGSALSISRGQEVVVADLAAVSAFSLVMSVKKEFYLGISIQDVLKNTFLADILQYIGVDSVIIIFGIGAYRFEKIVDEAKLFLLVAVNITYVLWICNLLYLFYNIAKLFVSTTKSELKAFNVLRYRLNGCYRFENRNAVDENQLNAVCEYLFKKIQKCYTRLEKKNGEICKVEVKSTVIDKNIWINIGGTICVGGIAAFFIGMGWVVQLNTKTGISIWLAGILSGITIVMIIIGCVKNIWAQVIFNKFFYVFEHKAKKIIAIKGFIPIWNRHYEFIENIQDALGLYKVLLDNNVPKRMRKIFVMSMNDHIEFQSLKNVMELLILYLEYEKDLTKGKNKKVWTRYNKKIERNSLEYSLANAILSEVYKNAKTENGIKDCKMLENAKFDHMVDCINKSRTQCIGKLVMRIEIKC